MGKGLTEPGHNLGDDDPLVILERAALTKQDAELARLKRLEEEHGARRRVLAALVNAAETWIKTASASMKIAMYPVEPPQLKKGESIADAVERLRRRGRELQADLDRVRAAPWPSALARERMRAQIASMAEAGRPLAHHLVDHGEPVAFARRSIPARVLNVAPEAIAFSEIPDTLALLAWLHQDELIRRLDAEIDTTADDANALDADQRRRAGGGNPRRSSEHRARRSRAMLAASHRRRADLTPPGSRSRGAARGDTDPRARMRARFPRCAAGRVEHGRRRVRRGG
ncbi:hypothetical protein [Bradyrhizobium zhanjiangense]|uniref:hypothetical protein n=1 Tax=Bradyrhizobium zhanjiangense TaxID=1325107 RepID=UPI001009301C|nr:hypothetical protein [Bradyrhizobium zhanjiangense]